MKQTACTDEERTFVPYVLVYLAPSPHYQWHEMIATTVDDGSIGISSKWDIFPEFVNPVFNTFMVYESKPNS